MISLVWKLPARVVIVLNSPLYSPFFFLGVAINSQKAILKKIKSAKIKVLFKEFNSQNLTKNSRKVAKISSLHH
jgi:hypothetical protein